MSFVYILRCSDNTFYVGHTNNLILATAIAREKQLKRWSSQKKEALITHDVRSLKQLSKRRKK